MERLSWILLMGGLPHGHQLTEQQEAALDALYP